jgi:HlyD family secretion protein
MKIKIKKRYIVIIAIVLLIILSFIIGGNGNVVNTVKMVAVARGDVESIISVSGTVKEKSENNVYVDTNVKVKDILVDENAFVRKGQKIVDFDMDSLNSSLASLRINKEVLELNYKKATISDENGLLSLVSTENAVTSAKDALERAEALYEVGAISKVEYDNAKTAYDNAKAGLTMSSSGMDYDLEVMEKNIQLTNIQINDLEKQISKLRTAMYSPKDGIISSINMKEGSYVAPSTPIYKIVNNSELEIKSEVKEFTVKSLSVGQKVYITGDAFDGYTYEGHIKSIAPIASTSVSYSTSQTTIEVIIDVDSKDTLLKSGLNVTCDIVTKSKENTLTIPVSSFNEDKDGNIFVYEVENGKLKKVFIETGIHSDEELEVISGLTEGEEIVKDMKSSFVEGMPVVEER